MSGRLSDEGNYYLMTRMVVSRRFRICKLGRLIKSGTVLVRLTIYVGSTGVCKEIGHQLDR